MGGSEVSVCLITKPVSKGWNEFVVSGKRFKELILAMSRRVDKEACNLKHKIL